jgi:GDP-D-mannose 3',5'-epimerase|tara:strand:+ start:434 stop:1408 length:975 start_codon:yes stop_codon:yes gene_type:complete
MSYKLVLGAGGFIGNHMVNRLKSENENVIGVDIKNTEFSESQANEFIIGDLTNFEFVNNLLSSHEFTEIYQYAADMGGAGYIFTGENDADVMHNSSLINLNVLKTTVEHQDTSKVKIFYSSSACIYPENLQLEAKDVSLRENDAYPANPDSEYGWEKLFSERMYLAFSKNYNLNVRIARFHNIYGPLGTWNNGKEKVPAAICRKVAEASNPGEIEIWGDGKQTRSFLFIDDCIEATRRLMASDFKKPLNIGSDENVSINLLADIVAEISKKKISVNHIDGPLGVRGRNSNNELIKKILNWEYEYSLKEGMKITYDWIDSQLKNK